MKDTDDPKLAPASVEVDRVSTDNPTPHLTSADNAPRANFRPLAQQLKRRVDHFAIGERLFDNPFPRAITAYVRKIANRAPRDNQSERNCDLDSFR